MTGGDRDAMVFLSRFFYSRSYGTTDCSQPLGGVRMRNIKEVRG